MYCGTFVPRDKIGEGKDLETRASGTLASKDLEKDPRTLASILFLARLLHKPKEYNDALLLCHGWELLKENRFRPFGRLNTLQLLFFALEPVHPARSQTLPETHQLRYRILSFISHFSSHHSVS